MPAVAVVGASRGIGRELARQYLADGWEVHATARRSEDIANLDAAGVHAAVADTTDEASLAAFAEGLPAIDVLIINAGVNAAKYELSIADVDRDEWLRVMTVNALGPVLAARALAGRIRKRGGKLVVLSSTMGSIADNSGGGSWSYRMSKAAVNMAVKNLAIMLRGDGIAAAALHPGWVKTDMGGAQAQIEASDSVAGLRKVIDELAVGDAREFVDYQGNVLPW